MSAPVLAPVPAGTPRPRVSIVLPTRRRPGPLGRMVRSILAQTFTDFDLHIREDGATDAATADVLRGFDDPRLHFTPSPSQLGIPGVVNALLADTTGEFVMVLHDHDVCRPGYLAAYVEALERFPEALYVFGGCDVVAQDGTLVVTQRRDDPPFTAGPDWLPVLLASPECPVFACGLVRRAAYERAGLLDPEFGFIADVELWCRLATLGGVAYVPDSLIAFTEREADHEYGGLNWTWVDAVVRIHRRYARQLRGGPVARLRHWRMMEQYLVGAYLTAVAPGVGTPERRAEARRHTRRLGGVVSRLVTWLR